MFGIKDMFVWWAVCQHVSHYFPHILDDIIYPMLFIPVAENVLLIILILNLQE